MFPEASYLTVDLNIYNSLIFYFSLRCQCNFGPFSDFYELNVYVEILNTLDWYYLHFFQISDPWCVPFQVKNKLSPTTLFIFLTFSIFFNLAEVFYIFCGFLETIYLSASFFSILKNYGSSVVKRTATKFSFSHCEGVRMSSSKIVPWPLIKSQLSPACQLRIWIVSWRSRFQDPD